MDRTIRTFRVLRNRRTLLVFLGVLVLFATTALQFESRVVDVGAARILRGEIPHRDFWTMYAPGSFYVVAALFAVFGVQPLASNVLGIVIAAAGVAALHHVADRAFGARAALLAAALFALSYLGSGFHRGFTSYPLTVLLVWAVGGFLAADARGEGRGRLVIAGVCLGLAAAFKHDVAGYAALAAAGALLLGGGPAVPGRVAAVLRMAGPAATVAAAVFVPLLVVAGDDLVENLVVFPLTYFPKVRPEGFPGLLPRWSGPTWAHGAKGLATWGACNFPLFLSAASLPALWRARGELDVAQRRLVLFALLAFPLFWSAAHVQINTHVVTLTGLAAILGSAAFLRGRLPPWRAAAAALAVAVWAALLLEEPAYRAYVRAVEGTELTGLPRLRGLRVTHRDARWMRALADAMARAAPPEASVLVLGKRNDILIFAGTEPYWLTDRRPVTRHHELHPGVTDTEPVQWRMLEDLVRGPLPVLVVEHRFDPERLEYWRVRFRSEGVPVGATLLDAWVAANYRAGPRHGMYQLMEAIR